jgi:beta-glucuronidase
MPTASATKPATLAAHLPLHGSWRREVGGVAIDTVTVPGTYPPLGECALTREITLPAGWSDGARCFLRTEGVLAWATFTVNGQTIGTAGPWSRYRFEIPAGLLRERNVVTAVIKDITQPFGPTPGRRFDAGLFRAIGIERRPRTLIADAHFGYTLSDDYARADVSVTVELDGADKPECACTLIERKTGRVVARAQSRAGEPIRFTVDRPRLWSPSEPFLYTMTVAAGGDELVEQVGFRRLESRGRDLWLNGERLVLKGVCRHEFMSGHGYSPPDEEVRRELAQIRHTGFNYIRLVHSPQSPAVARLAAEVGILVSEEPGTCFHDLGDPAVIEPALDALRAMVRRDRNVPSVVAWFIYNECNPNTPYAVRAVKACRELDPGALTGMADCSGRVDDIKAMVAASGLSLYGINSYTYWAPDYQKIMDTYVDRPLLITEWGGCIAQDNKRVMEWLCKAFADATHVDGKRRVAGATYWAWADYEEYSRPPFAAHEGWTIEGLIDKRRQPKDDLALMSRWCFEIDNPTPLATPAAEILLKTRPRAGAFTCIDLERVAGDQAAAEAGVEAVRNRIEPIDYKLPSLERVLVAGVEFACRGGNGPVRPLLLGKGRDLAVIPVGRRVSGLSVLGHVAFAGGYPSNSIHSVHHKDQEPARDYGADAAEYELVFEDGTEVVALKHGVNVLRANAICRWWTTDPRAPETTPAIRATIHPSYEVMRIDLWERTWARPRLLKEVRWKLRDAESIQALYALTIHDG